MTKPEVIIIHETVAQAWMRDASMVAAVVALIGIGVFLKSPAMQWVGAILAFVLIVATAVRFSGESKMTVSEARQRLDEIEAEWGGK